MPRHFVITCGTSQQGDPVEKFLHEANYYFSTNEHQALRGNQGKRETTLTDFSNYPGTNNPYDYDKFLNALKRIDLNNSTDYGADKNPLGAELNSMAHLYKANMMWNPEKDTITLLSSKTEIGMWCTAIVRDMLIHWGSQSQNIKTLLVDKLLPNPSDADVAVKNLATACAKDLKAHSDADDWIIVISGGFKSVIPSLSILALVSGAKMVYIFEDSDALQWIEFRTGINDPEDRQTFQQNILNKFITLLTGGSGAETLSDHVNKIINTWRGKEPSIY